MFIKVANAMRVHSCALCVVDSDDLPDTQLVSTASWGYIRLRREGYMDEGLRDWTRMICGQKWSEAYVFFRHKDTAAGVKLATRFLELSNS